MPDTLVYEVVHTSPELKTVYDYIVAEDSPAFAYVENPESFLNIKNVKGQTNREVIEATYTTKKEKTDYKGKSTKVMLLKVGTRLAIEQEKVNKAALMTDGFEIVSYDIPTFKAQALADLESKEGYTPQFKLKPIVGKESKGSVKETYPDATVWMWCRSLASESNNNQGEIFNLTPFIENLSTDVNKNGGNFSFALPPLIAGLNDQGKWIIKKKTVNFYVGQNYSLQNNDYVAEASMYELVEGELMRNVFLFHTIISPNDLVFIRFETLEMESEYRIADTSQLTIPKSELPDKIYDMIGLVDANTLSIQPSNNDVTIGISGRDLSKLFIEDGTYVFNLELTQGMLGGAGSSQDKGLSRRLIADKSLQYLGLYFNKTIEKVIKFVINQLSNIKVVPDQLFEAYGDRRNTRFEEKKDSEDINSNPSKQREALKIKAKASIKTIRQINKAALPSPADEKRKTEEIFKELYRFLKTIREKKVRITNAAGGTASWSTFNYINERKVTEKVVGGVYPQYFSTELFNLEITRQVLEGIPVIDDIDDLLDLEASASQPEGQLTRELASGVWQIVKLVLDKGVTNRLVIDSSLSSANGSLLNFIRKICQEPFVEYYMDTYGDMYHLIVRKPPTDQVGMLSMLRGQVVTEVDGGQNVTPAVIDIEPDEVLYEQFAFDDSEAISWYHLQPQANFMGGGEFSLSYLPAILLPEYADIWGSKPMQLVHNYLPSVLKDVDKNSLDAVMKQSVEDMRFMIQSTAHLPFTRKGVIKMNGDRRVKIGNVIRYKPTGEIFLVDHVKQEFMIHETTVDRTTTIQVSRGMVEQLIYGIPASSVGGSEIDGTISYFNIVNTTPVYEYSDSISYIEETVRKKGSVQSAEQSGSNQGMSAKYPLSSIIGKGNLNLHLLEKLSPEAQSRFVQLIQGINKLGYAVDITSGKRDFAEQFALHELNSKNAKPGHSRHELGGAIDLNLINRTTQVRLRKTSLKQDWLATGVPQLATQLNIKWGGQDFATYYDPVHFELREFGSGSQSSQTGDEYETKRIAVKGQSLDVGKIFSNFKVNKFVFDFFLRKQQMSYQKTFSKGLYSDKGVKELEEIIIKAKKK